MKSSLSSSDEKLLDAFEAMIDSGERNVVSLVYKHQTTIRNLSQVLLLIHRTDLQSFMTKYSNVKCASPVCGNTTKYKVNRHSYGYFCCTKCRYNWKGKGPVLALQEDQDRAIIEFNQKRLYKVPKNL